MRPFTLLTLILIAAPLLADPPAPTEKRQQANKDDQVICRTTPVIGSLIPTHKECRTKHDWDRLRVNLTGYNSSGSCASAEIGRCY